MKKFIVSTLLLVLATTVMAQQKSNLERLSTSLESCACPCHTKVWLDKESGRNVSGSLNINGKKYGSGPCHCDSDCAKKDRCNPKGKPRRVQCVCELREKLSKPRQK